MISADGLALRRGDKVLFENARFTFYARHKIGITGSNGSGKSSLFALLLGEMQVDSGNLGIQPGLVISHVAQELPVGSQSAIEFVIDGDVENGSLMAGQSVGMVKAEQPTQDIINELVDQALQALGARGSK